MTELVIFGRGGQGGVTLAKLIATAYFLKDKHVQAFGVYAAERSGAPVQAYVRVDDEEITNQNQIREPDHVIVLDRTLIGPGVLTGLKPDGWLILNTPDPPQAFSETFAGHRVATVDATAIAVSNGLGTRAVPIVNTTMLGAVARVFELQMSDAEAALDELHFGGPNVASARRAYEAVRTARCPGGRRQGESAQAAAGGASVAGLLDEGIGGKPAIRTGLWATRNPHRRRLTPPCNHACPAGNDVQGFLAAVADEDYDRALGILLETSPLPGVCGRVCPAPCMDACNRRLFDESLNIRELERYAADHGRRSVVRQTARPERIGVIGSGPAGLSAAYTLARLGYPVTLMESQPELGGVLRTGIPTYRLPRHVLDTEIDFILGHGVTAERGVVVDRTRLLDLTREYAAVFIGTGLQHARSLDLGSMVGVASGAMIQGIDFLDRVRRGLEPETNQRVVVVGGGNTAIDAARSAARLGAHVRIAYRRTRAEMPAIKEEIDEALEEGVELDELVLPLRFNCDCARPVLTCVRMRLGEPDASGRPRPVPETSEDAYFDIRCDRVILALGQSADLSILPEGKEIRETEGTGVLGVTGAPVFAGGDFAMNEGTVSAAIGSGRKAGLHIHRVLSGEDLSGPAPEPVATPDVMTTHVFGHAPRIEAETVAPELRRHSFAEVRRGLPERGDASPAAVEASRCFSCGVCNECDRCVVYCPEGVVVRDGSGYAFDYEYCKGCGVCATQCPRGVIYMSEL